MASFFCMIGPRILQFGETSLTKLSNMNMTKENYEY